MLFNLSLKRVSLKIVFIYFSGCNLNKIYIINYIIFILTNQNRIFKAKFSHSEIFHRSDGESSNNLVSCTVVHYYASVAKRQ